MEWFAQGENDGLCGFYASLNAISYLMKKAGWPLVKAERQSFFDSAVDCLMEDEKLAGVSALQILKGNDELGGICQVQIAGLCKRIGYHEKLAISVEEKPNNIDPVDFKKMFTKEMESGNTFSMIVVRRGGDHWVVVAPHQRKDHFTLIDNKAPVGRRFTDQPSEYVSSEAVILRLATK